MTLTIFDGIFVAVILAGIIWGAMKGLTWQLATVASLVMGYLVAYPAAGRLAPHFPGSETVSWLLALAASYVLVSGGAFLTAWLLGQGLRKLKFEAFDRHLGGVVGGVGGLSLAILATVLTISTAPDARESILTCTSGKLVSLVLETVHEALPDSLHKTMSPFWKIAHEEGLVAKRADEDLTADAATPTEAPRLARRETDPQAKAPGNREGSLIDRFLGASGKRVGRVVADAVESEAREAVTGSGRRSR